MTRLDGRTIIVSLCLLSFPAASRAAPKIEDSDPAVSSESAPRDSISLIDPGEVLLHWTAPGDDSISGQAAGYDMRFVPASSGPIDIDVEWNQAGQCPGEPNPSPSGQVDSMIVSGLEPGASYYFCIRAFDDAGNYSGLSNSPLMTAADGPPPDILPPTLISPPNGASINDHSPSLDWTDVGGADFYEVQVDNNSNFSSPERISAPSVSTWTVNPDLVSGTWYWRVRTHGEPGYSSWTNLSSFIITGLPPFGPPLLISPAYGAILDNSAPLLDWGSVADADFYQVVVDNNPDFSSLDRYHAVDSSEWIVYPGLPADTWYWMVRAHGGSGFSGWSGVWRFTVGDSASDFIPGDVNASGSVNGVDVVFLLNFLKGGPAPPPPMLRADANGDCIANGVDAVYLVNYLKGWGAPPIRGDCIPGVAGRGPQAPEQMHAIR